MCVVKLSYFSSADEKVKGGKKKKRSKRLEKGLNVQQRCRLQKSVESLLAFCWNSESQEKKRIASVSSVG